LILSGLLLLAVGLTLTATTPHQPVPWYSQSALSEELSGPRQVPGETPPTQEMSVELPSDANTGWSGLLWILIAMIPAAIGGGLLQPSINSLITKRIDLLEVGGMLGISAAMLSAANAIAPLIGGLLFQAIGPAAPFLIGGLMLLALLVVALQKLKPGSEVSAPVGMARVANSH